MNNILMNDLLKRDLQCIWHPFMQRNIDALPIPIERAKGAYLYDYEGRKYFDAISSWWVNLHGHAHPDICASIIEQVQKLDQTVFADFTHAPAIALAENLLRLLKMKEGRVFFGDNGSTSVECALKVCFQYWHNLGLSQQRKKVICFENAYHGDTFGAMSVAGQNHFNKPFWPYLFQIKSIPAPCKGQEEISLEAMRKVLAEGDVACFIFEPYIQGAMGMQSHSLAVLDDLIRLCKEQEVITIADEVMTGFGRTGNIFACDDLFHQPDIFCLSKGLSGGFLPIGATVCAGYIVACFHSDHKEHTFLHGHTYSGNALACASSIASLKLLERADCAYQRKFIQKQHESFKEKLGEHPLIKRCEVTGTILAVEYCEMNKQTNGYFSPLKERLKEFFMSRGVFIRPKGNVLYLMPPYCTSGEDLAWAYECIKLSLEELL